MPCRQDSLQSTALAAPNEKLLLTGCFFACRPELSLPPPPPILQKRRGRLLDCRMAHSHRLAVSLSVVIPPISNLMSVLLDSPTCPPLPVMHCACAKSHIIPTPTRRTLFVVAHSELGRHVAGVIQIYSRWPQGCQDGGPNARGTLLSPDYTASRHLQNLCFPIYEKILVSCKHLDVSICPTSHVMCSDASAGEVKSLGAKLHPFSPLSPLLVEKLEILSSSGFPGRY